MRLHRNRRRSRSGEGHDLSLHRLSDRHRQRISGFDPGARQHVQVTGQPAIYVKTTAESGNPRAQGFCPKCGSPIFSTTPGDGPKDSYMVRVGILRQRDQLKPRRQIWFRSARSWINELGGIPKDEKQTGTSHLR